jgi:hypothetical protein
MHRNRYRAVVMLLATLFASVGTVCTARQSKALAEGDGLATKYPGDQGIETDEAVIFADDFEWGDFRKWDEDQSKADKTRAAVTNDARLAFYGKHACRMTATRGRNNGAGLIKWLGDGHDEMYARFYVRFAEDAGYTHHFVHLNGSPERWGSFGKAGLRPKGDDFFTTGIEPWFDWGRNPPPGKWMFYTYWPEMKGSRDGKYWGNGFYPRGGVIRRGKWICMEIRVKMNTPGRDDGEQSVWQDGKLIGHFTGINWRTSEKLKANVFWLMSYVTDRAFKHTEQHSGRHKVKANTQTHTVWFDQVVVATAYIGPLRDPTDG